MQRRYKYFLQTDNFIEEIITITIIAAAPLCITATERDHVALYIIGKDITYKNILKRSKKSLKLSLKISLRTAFRSK
jgi:hypothetical protein